jgi:hypothetical protein
MHSQYGKLLELAKKRRNVLMIAPHGVGKTTMWQDISDEIGLRRKYYSASTLDPFADLVGVPVPGTETGVKHLEFVRPRDLDDAEFVLFDELNRAHHKVWNAILEVIQFKTINGEPLPNLKMVWAAINPPDGKYGGTAQMDPALMDRFHAHIELKAEPQIDYFVDKGIDKNTATALVNWWQSQPEDIRFYLPPRRLEYLGKMHMDGLDVSLAKPYGVDVSMQALSRMLRSTVATITREVLDDPTKERWILEQMDKDNSVQIAVARLIETIKFKPIVTYGRFLSPMRPEIRFEFFRRIEPKMRGWFTNSNLNVYELQNLVGAHRAREASDFLRLAREAGFNW